VSLVSRRRIPYPVSEGLEDGARASMEQTTGYLPAAGFLSRPTTQTPRRRAEVYYTAYNGLPGRAGLTMPELPAKLLGKISFRGRMMKFSDISDTTEPTKNIAGSPEQYGRQFGVPPIGNVYPRPTYRPPAPIIEMMGAPVREAGRVARMRQTRRLSALLPNPENLYQPQRYGEDYGGTRGGGGAGDYGDYDDA
jgi:hypothetical protein